ncbi:HNH endonuclease [Paraburkholderia sp. SUR17]|uniref:HNH endonuclease n=1 Tax=Paraburkholderia sp. SUR17 TaxID=3034358 RepID=UPI002407A3A5|nr:HNH endonuclease [Paraburkholderia sp. SUR17]WEY40081.1 HNH endonuclease [Paraburkholderia sp. SUR17]
MALFIQKPIFWNTRNYVVPSGVVATSGYPKDKGYGHEEWNNSPQMLLVRGGLRYRVFHTEGLGSAPLDDNAGQTFIFMTASHDGVQQLVGVAGNAAGLSQDHYREQRDQIVEDLSLHKLWADAWAVANVQEQYQNDQKQFMRDWKRDLHWIPNWICPDDFYWWLDEPITLDPRTITGKARLLGMFGSYTELNTATAARMLDAIPAIQRGEKWKRLSDAMQCAPTEPLATDDKFDGSEPVTSVLTRVNARRGQGQFREDLIRLWGGACSVTGLECREVLRASHVKPWAVSTHKQRLDSNNGLLLSANLDALFDKGLITFDDAGRMQMSPRLGAKHRAALDLPRSLRFVPKELAPYLKFHREKVFQG